MNRLQELAVRDNRESRERAEVFRPHRLQVTEWLRGGSPPAASRLCVLGAGNCNDLDLPALLAAHREVHLVDLDGEAVAWGLARQGLADSPAVRCHVGVDVTGVLDTVERWAPTAPVPDADLAACATAPPERVGPALAGPYDVAASVCLLSQLIRLVVHTAGEGHPRFLEALRAIRAGHLRLLAHLVAPGGRGVLITDFVSSDTFSPLGSVPEEALPGVLARLVQDGNFFHGLNPAVLASFFRTDPVVAPAVAELEQLPPWRWHFGPRVYAVCGFRFCKRAGTETPSQS
jgi:hypothetical protein